ncbi:hypothetical protein K439DRAFT_1323238, partial [Ramaria rubella]
STHSTRIERLWVEVGTQFARCWRAFLTRLETFHQLDHSNPAHLWLLHYLFLDALNTDCKEFQREWNLHPIRGDGAKGHSPADMWFMGETKKGKIINDDIFQVHPNTLHRYCGTYSTISGSHQTRAGHTPDEGGPSESSGEEESSSASAMAEDTDSEGQRLQERITVDLWRNVKHNPVKVTRHQDPFEDLGPSWFAIFERMTAEMRESAWMLEGYGLHSQEWDEDEYPSHEYLRVGRKESKLLVGLPVDIWYPWAVAWGQGLFALNRILFEVEDSESGVDIGPEAS